MVGQQRVLADKVTEIVCGWVGPWAGARGLNLSDWNPQLHRRTHRQRNAHVCLCTAEHARIVWRFLKVQRGFMTQQWRSASSCLSANLSVTSILLSLFLPLLVCLPTPTHTPKHPHTHLTPTVSYLLSLSHFMSSLSAGAHNITDALNGVESLQVEREQIFLMSLEVFHVFHSLHHH